MKINGNYENENLWKMKKKDMYMYMINKEKKMFINEFELVLFL